MSLQRAYDPSPEVSDLWADDVLDRQNAAQRFSRILESADGPLVVSISSPFGTGKSFFARRWLQQLRQEGKTALYANVWDTDFAEDPLIAFIGQLHDNIEELGLTLPASKRMRNKLLEIAKTGLNIGLRIGLRAALGAAVHSAVDGKVDNVADAALKQGTDEAEKYVLGRIKNFSNEQSARTAFKEQLSAWQKEVVKARKRRRSVPISKDEKTYIIIDELDRCRPEYAVKMLESIKHLFSVEGIIFVLFVDEGQLQRQTNTIYGERPDGEPFLRKFIDYRLSLPRPSNEDFCKFLLNQSQFKVPMFAESGNRRALQDSDFIRDFSFFAEKFNLSLRTQFRVFRTIELVLLSYNILYLSPLIFLACLREHNLEGWHEFTRVLKAPESALTQVDYLQFKKRYNDVLAEDNEELLKTYLYVRIFFDEEKLDGLPIDYITKKAKEFFNEHFFSTTK